MAGKKSDAESFASRWANKGNENQDTQRFWIDFYQNVLGVEDAVSRLEFEERRFRTARRHARPVNAGWVVMRNAEGDVG